MSMAVEEASRAGFVALAFVVGLVVGSFLNVVVHRVPRGESVVRPRSRCPGCGSPIAAFDNVPVLSWLWLRGRCRRCRAPISWRYPAFELVTGLVFAAVAWQHGLSPMTLPWWTFAALLLAAAGIDFEHRIIPDAISLGGLGAGLVLVPTARVVEGMPVLLAVRESALGALLGGALLWSVGFAHARLCVALGRTFEHWPGEGESPPRPGSLDYWTWFPGLGFGDVKLLAMIGAFVGPVGVVYTILASSLAGLALGLVFALATRSLAAPFGFAPAIAVGALLVALFPSLQSLP
jgi:leader peptidase (prepilin peptidase)/N-methyltransferase